MKIAPTFDEEGAVQSIQMVMGFEHELLAREIVEAMKPFFGEALGKFAEQFIEDSVPILRGEMAGLFVRAMSSQEVRVENDATKAW